MTGRRLATGDCDLRLATCDYPRLASTLSDSRRTPSLISAGVSAQNGRRRNRSPPPFGKNARPSARFNDTLRSLGAEGAGQHTLRQRERDEEAAIGARVDRVGHELVQRDQARVEARQVQLLQALDLRLQEPAPAPLVGDALRQIAWRDVGVFGHLGELRDQVADAPIMNPVRTPGAISFVNEHMNSVRSGARE